MPETILALCAHNDDQVIGAGGTLAKYAQKGATVKSMIFSFGEQSHPHLKPEVIIKTRIKESLDADKILRGKGVAYLGLKEGKFKEEIANKRIRERLLEVVKRERPSKIFTHGSNDPHPDHHAVYELVRGLLSELHCDVYTFEVWSPFQIRDRFRPKLLVDISDTFETKLRALRSHRSQKLVIINLISSIFIKAKFNGLVYGYTYAEVFDKLL